MGHTGGVLLPDFNVPIAPQAGDYGGMVEYKKHRTTNMGLVIQNGPGDGVAIAGIVHARLVDAVPIGEGIAQGTY